MLFLPPFTATEPSFGEDSETTNIVISSAFLLGPNFLITLLFNALYLCIFLNMRNQVSTTNRSKCILNFKIELATKAQRVSSYIVLLFLDPRR